MSRIEEIIRDIKWDERFESSEPDELMTETAERTLALFVREVLDECDINDAGSTAVPTMVLQEIAAKWGITP